MQWTLIKHSFWQVCKDRWQLAVSPHLWAGAALCGPWRRWGDRFFVYCSFLSVDWTSPSSLHKAAWCRGHGLGEPLFSPNCKLKLPLILFKLETILEVIFPNLFKSWRGDATLLCTPSISWRADWTNSPDGLSCVVSPRERGSWRLIEVRGG